MHSTRLDRKRVLITQSQDFMRPVLCEVFSQLVAQVIAGPCTLADDPGLPATLIAATGTVDVLALRLSLPALSAAGWR